MPTLAEILETLTWYRPLEEIESDEGITVTKISIEEVELAYAGKSQRWIISADLPS